MTREEAIKILWQYDVNFEPHPAEEVMHAIDMAIEALQDRQTKHTLPDGTEILIDEESYEIGYSHGQMADRPTGKWTFEPKDAIELMFTKPKCSECGFESADGGNFCSNCGAKMYKGGDADDV